MYISLIAHLTPTYRQLSDRLVDCLSPIFHIINPSTKLYTSLSITLNFINFLNAYLVHHRSNPLPHLNSRSSNLKRDVVPQLQKKRRVGFPNQNEPRIWKNSSHTPNQYQRHPLRNPRSHRVLHCQQLTMELVIGT